MASEIMIIDEKDNILIIEPLPHLWDQNTVDDFIRRHLEVITEKTKIEIL